MENDEIKKLILDKENLPNSKLIESLDFLSQKHEKIKNTIINLSYQLDETTVDYENLLNEYKKRNKK